MTEAETPLARARLRAGLSRPKLAQLVGTSPQQIERLEKNLRKLTKEWAVRLAAHLDCTPEELIFGDMDEGAQVRDRLASAAYDLRRLSFEIFLEKLGGPDLAAEWNELLQEETRTVESRKRPPSEGEVRAKAETIASSAIVRLRKLGSQS